MKREDTSEIEKKHGGAKKHKTFFSRLIEFQLRKTESDKRREMFGFDPFRVKENLSF